jgi:hypothetical protein
VACLPSLTSAASVGLFILHLLRLPFELLLFSCSRDHLGIGVRSWTSFPFVLLEAVPKVLEVVLARPDVVLEVVGVAHVVLVPLVEEVVLDEVLR